VQNRSLSSEISPENFHKISHFLLGKYYFPTGSGGTISLHHSCTPSLPVRHLETGGGGGNSHMKRSGILIRKFEFNF